MPDKIFIVGFYDDEWLQDFEKPEIAEQCETISKREERYLNLSPNDTKMLTNLFLTSCLRELVFRNKVPLVSFPARSSTIISSYKAIWGANRLAFIGSIDFNLIEYIRIGWERYDGLVNNIYSHNDLLFSAWKKLSDDTTESRTLKDFYNEEMNNLRQQIDNSSRRSFSDRTTKILKKIMIVEEFVPYENAD